MYVITVEFTINPVHQPEFMEAVRHQARNSVTLEKECHTFDVAWGEADQNTVFLYEVYTDRAAFDAHLASSHFKTFDKLVSPWVVGKVVKGWIQPI